mgnify:CR=1 FL=1
MYLLIDIGNTRIKWQQRDDKHIELTDSILVEDFMDIDFSVIKSVEKIMISNVNHSIVLDTTASSYSVYLLFPGPIYSPNILSSRKTFDLSFYLRIDPQTIPTPFTTIIGICFLSNPSSSSSDL